MLRVVAVASLFALSFALTELSEYSFRGPFQSGNHEGIRVVDGWSLGGSGEVRRHFVRLTPDRQSKKGQLWNHNALKLNTLSLTLRFRISGQGKKYFGDGLTLWATTSQYWHEGLDADFKGFGLTLDTFKNDHAHAHRDILFFTANGGPPTLPQEPTGCDSNYRYWEGLHDFSAANYSGVRVSIQQGRVSVFVDPRGTDTWTECFRDAAVATPAEWWTEGYYLGLSALTGDLADNHDVLSLVVTLEDEPAPASAPVDLPALYTTGHDDIDAAIGASAAREAANTARLLADLQHDLEHQLTSVKDGLKSALSKLQNQEVDNERRIAALEERLGDKVSSVVQGSLNERIESLERQIAGSIRAQLDDHVLPSIHGRVDRSSTISIVAVSVLGLVVASITVFAWRKYRYLKKSHLL